MTVRTLSPAHTDSHVQPVVTDYTDSTDDLHFNDERGDEYNITPLVSVEG
jgi:hypothetical protein